MSSRLWLPWTLALLVAAGCGVGSSDAARALDADPAITLVYPTTQPEGLLVTTGGWAYCEQMRPVARRAHYTLLCGRYAQDGYVGPGLRSLRQLDWGNPRYLDGLAARANALHRRIGGTLVLVGVSYSGFGVATLASHHPELRPDRLIVIDSYLDLVARREQLPDAHETAREIDHETGGSTAVLRERSVSVDGLAQLVRAGTRLTMIWSISDHERRFFNGATCNRRASAETLARLARTLDRPVPAWITETKHGSNLWKNGVKILRGTNPGREVIFRPDGAIPAGSVCAEPR